MVPPTDSESIPVTLEPLYELIKGNIAQLQRASQTDEVKRALEGLRQAKSGLEFANCPGMFLNVKFM